MPPPPAPPSPSVLLIEDEQRIADFVRAGLTERGFSVEVCDDGNAGFALACRHAHDVIVLDLMLPGRDGLSVLKGLRAEGVVTPVILLTARNELGDRIEGLGLGADDYLAKPFYVEELAARIQALLRRLSGERQNLLRVGALQLDRIAREVTCQGQTMALTAREFALVELLMRSAGRVLTRTQILEQVWGYDFPTTGNALEVYIGYLRRKTEADGEPRLIHTVRGVGYVLRESPP